MKFLIAIGTLAAGTLGAKYPAGTNCHTNTECNDNCVNGRWTIVNAEGGYIFACDPDTPDPTEYIAATCTYKYEPNTAYGREQLQPACDANGGTTCAYGCVFSISRSEQEDLEQIWAKACDDSKAYPSFVVARDQSNAEDISRCDLK